MEADFEFSSWNLLIGFTGYDWKYSRPRFVFTTTISSITCIKMDNLSFDLLTKAVEKQECSSLKVREAFDNSRHFLVHRMFNPKLSFAFPALVPRFSSRD